MTTSVAVADSDARRGLRLVVLGVAAIPMTVILVGVAPRGARSTLFLLGLAIVAAVSIAGSVWARRGLSAGTKLRARAIVGAMTGLWIGVTAAVLWFWTLVGIVL